MQFKAKISLLLIILWKFTYSQIGNYAIHNYLPAQYNASDQNRCILQDKYGRIFVANNDGILINNGSEWMKTRTDFICLTMGKNDKEEIFLGGAGNFGKIIQKQNGEYNFESLIPLLPKGDHILNKFWSIIVLKGHVYFCSNQKILDYNYKTISVILPGEEGFHTFYNVDEHLVVREKGKGLKVLSDKNELVLINGGEIFADNNNPVRGIIKGDKNHYIMTPQGVFEFEFNATKPEHSVIKKTNSPIDSWLQEKILYCSSNIGQNNFAFGSVLGGLVITDKKFNPVKYINSSTDLQDDGVNYIYNDNQGHIWLALAKGISQIEFNSPITSFTKSDGIKGTVESCIFFNKTPYLATEKGILKYNEITSKFEITNISEAAWCLTEANGQLLAGTQSGLYILEKNEFRLAYETPSAAHCVYAFPGGSGLIYIGTETGYAKGILKANKFQPVKEQFDLDADIRTIASSDDKSVFFGTRVTGIGVERPESDTIIFLGNKEGLPNLFENYLFQYDSSVLIATDLGIYQVIKKGLKYSVIPAPGFEIFTNKYTISRGISIKNNVWITAKPLQNKINSLLLKETESLLCLEKINSQFKVKPMQLSRIKESDPKSFCYNDSLVYIGTNNGLYCYDLALKHGHIGLNTFINSIFFGKDSTLLYYNINPNTQLPHIEMPFRNNSVLIKLGASDYIDKNELLFSYYLHGRDSSYGAFSPNKTVKYEYLHEGDYIFYVKSRNILGIEGEEIKIPFTVLPPWYRTVWAYFIYAILFLTLVYIIIKLNSRRLIEQNLRLEKIIAERTKEVNRQKLEIEHKNHEITDSINYAKGIQDSILPSINEIKKTWPDLFVFFQPKDIVSGDFYWYKQINNDEFLIAAADCTGHGVPGGFMSMICSGKLHDAARETTEPDQILFLANNSIKESLRQQSEGKSKDGMEICLIKVNTKTLQVKYAGANRQLWIFHSETGELSEIKPTKASIASFTEFNFNYKLHELQLKKGDVLYLSTDGYPDQFGGSEGKKYMSKNLKNYLAGISSLPMHKQGIEVSTNINNWMGIYEQVDDLLVIGIKL